MKEMTYAIFSPKNCGYYGGECWEFNIGNAKSFDTIEEAAQFSQDHFPKHPMEIWCYGKVAGELMP